jgi:hypothetical protein
MLWTGDHAQAMTRAVLEQQWQWQRSGLFTLEGDTVEKQLCALQPASQACGADGGSILSLSVSHTNRMAVELAHGQL